METRTLKQWLLEYKEIQDQIEFHEDHLEFITGTKRAYYKKHLHRLNKKRGYIRRNILSYGSGTVVKINWEEYVGEENQVKKLSPFELLLVNTDLENSKDYFNFIMKDRIKNIKLDSLNFEEIQAGKSGEKLLNKTSK